MCLLHWLIELQKERGLQLYAAHFEHGIRGDESLQDAVFVEEQCRMLHVPLTIGHGDVPGFAVQQKLGTEEAARILRSLTARKTLLLKIVRRGNVFVKSWTLPESRIDRLFSTPA